VNHGFTLHAWRMTQGQERDATCHQAVSVCGVINAQGFAGFRATCWRSRKRLVNFDDDVADNYTPVHLCGRVFQERLPLFHVPACMRQSGSCSDLDEQATSNGHRGLLSSADKQYLKVVSTQLFKVTHMHAVMDIHTEDLDSTATLT
jgi:hypothetical protein